MSRPLGSYPFPFNTGTGVYRITNVKSGAVYIGSAVNLFSRWRRHHNELNKGIHSNPHLLRSWRKYGSGAFVWEVVEATLQSELLEREQYWLDRLRGEGVELYNVCVTAGSHLGVVRSEETKRKMSEIAKQRGDNGLVRDEEWRSKVSQANTLNAQTRCDSQMRERVSASKRGNQYVKGRVWAHDAEGRSYRVSTEDGRLRDGSLRLGRTKA